MRKLALLFLASSLAVLPACGTIDSASQLYLTVSSSNVPAKTIYVAANAFNATKAAAIGYIQYCTPNPTPAGCNDKVIQEKIIPAIDKGTAARKTLLAFLQKHPGELGDKGTYDLLLASTSSLKTLLATNDKR